MILFKGFQLGIHRGIHAAGCWGYFEAESVLCDAFIIVRFYAGASHTNNKSAIMVAIIPGAILGEGFRRYALRALWCYEDFSTVSESVAMSEKSLKRLMLTGLSRA